MVKPNVNNIATQIITAIEPLPSIFLELPYIFFICWLQLLDASTLRISGVKDSGKFLIATNNEIVDNTLAKRQGNK